MWQAEIFLSPTKLYLHYHHCVQLHLSIHSYQSSNIKAPISILCVTAQFHPYWSKLEWQFQSSFSLYSGVLKPLHVRTRKCDNESGKVNLNASHRHISHLYLMGLDWKSQYLRLVSTQQAWKSFVSNGIELEKLICQRVKICSHPGTDKSFMLLWQSRLPWIGKSIQQSCTAKNLAEKFKTMFRDQIETTVKLTASERNLNQNRKWQKC